MSTIPASQNVQVIPGVVSAGGNDAALSGLLLTPNTRVPVGQVLSFPNDGTSVSNFFGPGSPEAAASVNYFLGFDTSQQKPSAILFAQYNQASVAAYLRGGNINALTLAQLQALSGSLSITVDGAPRVAGSVDLSSSTSFSSAASIIAAALNNTLPAEATVTAVIAPATTSFTGSIAGQVLNVTAVSSGVIVPGAALTGTGVSATKVTNQLSGTPGGIGTYAVDVAQVVPVGTTFAGGYGVMNVSAVASGSVSVGQQLSGSGVTAGTEVTALDGGSGGTGTYYVSPSQTVASPVTVSATGTPVAVTYDSVSGAFIVASGIAGVASTIGFATGSLAGPISLTSAKGAVTSQGADGASPGTYMATLVGSFQAFASFMNLTDPDDGAGNAQKLAFGLWVSQTLDRYAYVAWDTDVAPAVSQTASGSLGGELETASANGTILVWSSAAGPNDGPNKAAFVCGMIASIDFEAFNGRITLDFKGQAGLVADVTDATTLNNLIANGYNAYCAVGTAAQAFVNFQPGQITGEFDWADSYVNQIWLNGELQLALMVLLTQANSIPYITQGYAQIQAALLDPINAALNAGVIRAGVPLSAAEAAAVNAAAGVKIDDVLTNIGWYLQILPAPPLTRVKRKSPPMKFWYTDGQSVQQIVLNSDLVQ